MTQGHHNTFSIRDENPPAEDEQTKPTWVHHTERSSMAVVQIPPGGGLAPHYHQEHDELMIMVEGQCRFRLGDGELMASAGEVVAAPAGTVHAPVFSKDGCLMLAVFAPWFDTDNPDRIFVED